MTQIGQDTHTVHLTDTDDHALCGGTDGTRMRAQEWKAGFTPASAGARVCAACEAKAGTAATFEPGERDAEARAAGLPTSFEPRDIA